MKIIILLLIASVSSLMLSGCEREKNPEEDTPLEHEIEKGIQRVMLGDVEIIVIDGCEYIVYNQQNGHNQGYGFMAHKGNCKNPIHIHAESETIQTAP